MNKRHEQLQRREFLTRATQTVAVAFAAPGWRSGLVAVEANASGLQQRLPIQIGILLETFRGTLEARLDAVKAAGLDCVQLGMDSAGLSAMPDEIPPALAEQIRRAAAARGIFISAPARATAKVCGGPTPTIIRRRPGAT
jgi:hypothetical protein